VATPRFQAPKGTRDVLAPESDRWQRLIARFADHVARAGYGLVLSPMFEDLGVFVRLGEGTDVVTKEMYDFDDKGGDRIALRPEGTASIVRAYAQHRPTLPFKAWYAAPSFRYERPQAGRFRQHHQLGIEVLGIEDPDCDVEVISVLWDFHRSLGLRQLTLKLNSMGTSEDRERYATILQDYLRSNLGDLAEGDQAKVEANPLRVLDTKRPPSLEVLAAAPQVADHLDDASAAHFERVRGGLDAAGIPYTLDPRLVRGLDYYVHTLFEVAAEALDGAQNAIGGGGRYDGLVADMGGPPTPGVGFGSGIERILLACEAEGVFDDPGRPLDAYVIDLTGGERGRDLALELRRAGFGVDRGYGDRSMKSQIKTADRSGARLALIIGDDEAAADTVTIKHLRDDTPQATLPRADLAGAIGD